MVEPEIPSCTDVVLGFPKQEEEDIHAKHIENHEEVAKDVVCSFLKASPIVNVTMTCQNHCSNAECRAVTWHGKHLLFRVALKEILLQALFFLYLPQKSAF